MMGVGGDSEDDRSATSLGRWVSLDCRSSQMAECS